jgi:hypothetical protein
MRLTTGNSVIELGGEAGETIAASATLTFDWIPGRSEWSTWEGTYDDRSSGGGPSPYHGTAVFDVPTPVLDFHVTPSGFHFEFSPWEKLDGNDGSTEMYPWTWSARQGSLGPSVWSEVGHNSWRSFNATSIETSGSSLEGGFHSVHQGEWRMRETPDLIAFAGGGDDVLDGGTGEDVLDGGAGDDVIVDGLGATIMTGGRGADTFVFGAGSGMDIVRDFKIGEDRLSFVLAEGADGAEGNSIVDKALAMAGSSVLDLGGGHTILLAGVSHAALLSAGAGVFAEA